MTETKEKSVPGLGEVATAAKDLDVFAGYLRRLENPDPVVLSRGGGRGIRLYDEVAADAHAGAVLRTRFLSLAACEWQVDPGGQAEADQEAARLVRRALLSSNFSQAVAELAEGILYGFKVAEVLWQVADGLVTPQRIVGKHPRRFSFTAHRELRLLTPSCPAEGEPVPDKKFIVFSWGDSDSPYGRALGRSLWWPVWFKKNGVRFWLTFLERFGQPTVVGAYPPGTPPDQQAKLLDAISALQNETGIKIPDTMKLSLLEASRNGRADYEGLCAYMDAQVSKAVLGQTLTTEVGKSGSYAASRTHEAVRRDLLKADADLLAETINASLVKWIVDFNLPGAAYPALWFVTDPPEEPTVRLEREKTLVKDLGLAVPARYFRETYGLPAPAPG
ncbi:MAG: DUF935 family protein, partial [Pseudomonadota bacterium]